MKIFDPIDIISRTNENFLLKLVFRKTVKLFIHAMLNPKKSQINRSLYVRQRVKSITERPSRVGLLISSGLRRRQAGRHTCSCPRTRGGTKRNFSFLRGINTYELGGKECTSRVTWVKGARERKEHHICLTPEKNTCSLWKMKTTKREWE